MNNQFWERCLYDAVLLFAVKIIACRISISWKLLEFAINFILIFCFFYALLVLKKYFEFLTLIMINLSWGEENVNQKKPISRKYKKILWI